ncbi:hypothetical protein [Microbacterium indicum]|uniref:hypothetical protein n=1 Tax=Microbacterium indicum TaxID=358100 RepID=UPI0003FDD5BA|nr:hypothetical protein [Microbacterium indicum]
MRLRWALVALAAAFVVYYGVRGLLNPIPYDRPGSAVLAVAMLFAAAAVALGVPATGPRDRERLGPGAMPRWAAGVSAALAAALPFPALDALSSIDDRAAPHATWYIGAAGVILTTIAVRRRFLWAIAGLAALAVTSTIVLRALGTALAAGLVGSALWVALAITLVTLADRAFRDTLRLTKLQHESSAWRASQIARRRERRERVQLALGVAGPVLTRVIESQAQLDDAWRDEALFAEATLRDELRGTALLDDAVRAAIAGARRRGSVVSLYDEGGLAGLDEAGLQGVRAELARTIAAAGSAQIIVRTSRLPATAVTVVGRASDDEDDVDLWNEIPRP